MVQFAHYMREAALGVPSNLNSQEVLRALMRRHVAQQRIDRNGHDPSFAPAWHPAPVHTHSGKIGRSLSRP
jgi:hypothetical protein